MVVYKIVKEYIEADEQPYITVCEYVDVDTIPQYIDDIRIGGMKVILNKPYAPYTVYVNIEHKFRDVNYIKDIIAYIRNMKLLGIINDL